MASSLILQGGAAVSKTLKETITQNNHEFVVGDVVRWDGTLVTPKYVKAKADTALNAEVAGVVSLVADANNFELVYHGYIEIDALSARTDPVMFLSADTAGGLTGAPPSAVGTVVKPVLTKNTNSTGYLVMNYLGTQIGGSSTVAVDEIQPVGTIMPFAGTVIPDTWLECDGGSYGITDYPELYEKLLYADGERAPLYGYVVELGMISSANVYYANLAVGNILLFKGSGSPTATSYDAAGLVVSKTAPSIANPGAHPVTVKILPKYDSGTKKFQFPNFVVTTGTGIVPFTDYTLAARVAGSVANAHGSNFIAINKFLTPDLRGRFLLGVNPAATGETEGDTTFISSTGQYDMGQLGGQESVPVDGSLQLGAGTSAKYTTTSNSNTGSVSNLPPYLAVRYIIKAKPYTRAAIIDGIDLPYNSLLVTDLRTRNVGGSNNPLIIKTNTSGDSGSGTERMRITTDGKVGIGTTVPQSLFDVTTESNGFAHFGRTLNVGAWTGIGFGYKDTDNNNTALYRKAALVFERTDTTDGFNDARGKVHILNRGGANGGGSATLSHACLTINHTGDVGIGNTSPGATLDVNGTLKVGDFGGSTNVMAKLNNNISSSNGDIGCAVPLLAWAGTGTTTPLPAGTWFVYLNGFENGTGDEDLCFVMAKVWTVTSGNWLRFKSTNATQTAALSRVQYSLGNNSTTTESAGTWVEFSTTNANTYYSSSGVAASTMFGTGSAGTHAGNVFLQGNSAIGTLGGYAIRIA
jgi:hypothetical protein